MISREEIQHIYALAKLELKEEEIDEVRRKFSDILDFTSKILEVKTPDDSLEMLALQNERRYSGGKLYQRRRVKTRLRDRVRIFPFESGCRVEVRGWICEQSIFTIYEKNM